MNPLLLPLVLGFLYLLARRRRAPLCGGIVEKCRACEPACKIDHRSWSNFNAQRILPSIPHGGCRPHEAGVPTPYPRQSSAAQGETAGCGHNDGVGIFTHLHSRVDANLGYSEKSDSCSIAEGRTADSVMSWVARGNGAVVAREKRTSTEAFEPGSVLLIGVVNTGLAEYSPAVRAFTPE
jgi:hypothetical protein